MVIAATVEITATTAATTATGAEPLP
jgi:hypothetical protein